MEKNLKVISIIVMMFFLIFSNNLVFADEQNYELIIDNKGIKFSNEDKVFIKLEEMVPGDSQNKSLTIKNNGNKPQEIFMRAERLTEESDADLLSKIKLEINYNEKNIYEGSASGEDGLSKDISLGVVKPGEEHKLDASVVLDGMSTGNEYHETEGKVEWIFTTMVDNTISTPDDNNQSEGVISPQTGDSGIAGYVLLFATCIVLLYLSRKRVKGGKNVSKY